MCNEPSARCFFCLMEAGFEEILRQVIAGTGGSSGGTGGSPGGMSGLPDGTGGSPGGMSAWSRNSCSSW